MNASVMLHTIKEVRRQDFLHLDFRSTRYSFIDVSGNCFEVTVFGDHREGGGDGEAVPFITLADKDYRVTAA